MSGLWETYTSWLTFGSGLTPISIVAAALAWAATLNVAFWVVVFVVALGQTLVCAVTGKPSRVAADEAQRRELLARLAGDLHDVAARESST